MADGVVVAWVAAGVSAVAAGVSIWQAKYAKTQADASKSQATSAEQQARAAESSVKVAELQLAVTQEANKLTAAMVTLEREKKEVRVHVKPTLIVRGPNLEPQLRGTYLGVEVRNLSAFSVWVTNFAAVIERPGERKQYLLFAGRPGTPQAVRAMDNNPVARELAPRQGMTVLLPHHLASEPDIQHMTAVRLLTDCGQSIEGRGEDLSAYKEMAANIAANELPEEQ